MRKSSTIQPSGFWMVAGAAILWGTIGIATQAIYNLETTNSLFINLMRMIIGAIALLLTCRRVVGARMFAIRRRDLAIMALNGVLLAVSQATYFSAIHYGGVTIATLLAICVAPLVVTSISVLLKFETLTRYVVAALVCAVAGSVLLVGFHSPDGVHDQLLLGSLLGVISAATYGGMILCGRFLAADYHPLQVTAITFTAGALILLPVNLINGIELPQTSQAWVLMLYLGLVTTALAYWLFQTGLRSIPATTASLIGMLDPLVAAILAWALFGETLQASGILGAGLMMASIVLLSRDRRDVPQAVSATS